MKIDQNILSSKAKKNFKIPESKKNVIYPPDQVFINPHFTFLLTIRGHLADNEKEYKKLMTYSKSWERKNFI